MEYLSLGKSIDHEVVIQKSRFIGLTYLIPAKRSFHFAWKMQGKGILMPPIIVMGL
jgi:hypothetical protein